jgi:hypothetical protein
MSKPMTEKDIQNRIWKGSDGVGGDSEDQVIGLTGSLPDRDGQLDGWMTVVGS